MSGQLPRVRAQKLAEQKAAQGGFYTRDAERNPDVGQDGTVGMKVKAEGNAKFFKVVMPEQK